MMMDLYTVAALFPKLDVVELSGWVHQRWVQPDVVEEEVWVFQEIDLARVHLIYDLRYVFDTPKEAVSLVLGMLDQVYELRAQNERLKAAIGRQNSAVQTAIREALSG